MCPHLKTRERIKYIDISKGILIILLLVHHYSSATRRLNINPEYDFFAWQCVFTSFFMQCFFIISGYCSSFNKNTESFLKGIFRQLFIPYLTFQILNNLFYVIMQNDYSLKCFLSTIINVPNTSLWFLNALIFCKILIYILKKATNDIGIITFSIGTLIMGVIIHEYNLTPNYFCYHNSLCSLFFVALGNYLKNKHDLYTKVLKYSLYLYPIFFIILLSVNKYPPVLTANIGVTLRNLPIFLLTSLSGSFAFLSICKIINQNRFIEYFGKHSLIIYALHFFPLYCLVLFFNKLISPTNLIEYTTTVCLIYFSEISVCAIIIYLFNTKYFKWIVGK